MKEKIQPFVASSPKQIHDLPVNTSSAKQLYSIPKAERFHPYDSSRITASYYDMPSLRSKRAAGFGYGNKYDLTKMAMKSPAPNKYNIRDSSFDDSKIKHKGYSFGLGREEMSSFGSPVQSKVPGPGSYEPKNMKHSLAYTIRAKTTAINQDRKGKENPGPGAYKDVANLNDKGKYIVSKFKSMGGTVFSPPSSKRFGSEERAMAPGPGQYNPKLEFNDNGKYYLSKFKSNGGRSFPLFTRQSLVSHNAKMVPGPGSYRLPSDFGFYKPMKNVH